ncbi:MAG TPA: methylated-DNA--[protein]-cysteine S-methyltransferase [Solirubrobacteraceae bacterium]|nr:methylated-DNA--[protein]-cysteine S-methyltransferase [Solirubrobacteraceae bacterium]
MLYTHLESPIGRLTLCGDEERLTGLYTAPRRHDPALVRGARRAQEPFARVRDQLEQYFDGERLDFDVPLSLDGGSGFFQSVWQSLLEIPYGTTTTYGKLARKLGHPTAARAVGLANGRNPIAIIVPCHRVIGGGGDLTGYAGGLERKRFLLDHETDVLRPKAPPAGAADDSN